MYRGIIFLSLISVLSAQMSLKYFLGSVAKKNIKIQTEYMKYEQKDSKYYTRILPERPELVFERNEIMKGESFETANEKTLAISQKFEFPVIYYYKAKTANLESKIAYQNYLEAGITVLLDAKKDVLKLLILQEKQKFVNAFLKRYSLLLSQMKRLKSVGEISEMSFLRISLEYEELLNEQKRLETNLFIQRDLLEMYVPNFSENISDSILVKSFLSKQVLRKRLEKNSPVMRRRNFELEQSKYESIKEYLNRLPTFSFTYRRQSINREYFYGLEFGMSIPLWIPRELEEVKHGIIQEDIAEINVDAEKRSINIYFEMTWKRFQSHLKNLNRFKNSLLPKAERVFLIAEKQYRLGDISYFEFIDNYRIWKNTRLSELNQRLSVLLVQAELEKINLLNYLK